MTDSEVDPNLEGAQAAAPTVPGSSSQVENPPFELHLAAQASSKTATELAAEYVAQSAGPRSTSAQQFQVHAGFNPHQGPPLPPPFTEPATPPPAEIDNAADQSRVSGTHNKKDAKGKVKEDKAKRRNAASGSNNGKVDAKPKRKRARKDVEEETLEEDTPIGSPSSANKKMSSGKAKRVKLVGKGY